MRKSTLFKSFLLAIFSIIGFNSFAVNETIDMSSVKLDGKLIKGDNITINVDDSKCQNKVLEKTDHIRIYTDAVIKFQTADPLIKINSVKFTFTEDSKSLTAESKFSCGSYDLTTKTWTAPAGGIDTFSVVLAAQIRVKVFELDITKPANVDVVADPVITPESQQFSADFVAQISCTTEGAEIYYTLDGSVPSKTNGAKYTAEGVKISGKKDVTLKAIAYNGKAVSEVVSATYSFVDLSGKSVYEYAFTATAFNKDTAELNGFNWILSQTGISTYRGYDGGRGAQIGSGKSDKDAVLSITTSDIKTAVLKVVVETAGSANFYVKVGDSVLGDTVALSSSNASYEFTGNATGDLQFCWKNKAAKAVYIKSIYVIYASDETPTPTVVEAPVFGVAAGNFSEAFDLALSCATEGAAIHYSLDGGADSLYSAPIRISKTTEVKAWAIKGDLKSDTVSAKYVLVETPNPDPEPEQPAVIDVASLAEFSAKASADSVSHFCITGAVTVTYINGGQIFLQDSTFAITAYDKTAADSLHIGDHLTGIVAKYAYHNGLQLGIVSFPVAVAGEAVADVKTISEVTPDIVNRLVSLKDVELVSDVEFAKGKAVDSSVKEGESVLAIRSHFKQIEGSFKAGDKLNITGIVSQFKDAMQIKLVSVEKSADVALDDNFLSHAVVYANSSNIYVEAEEGAVVEVYSVQGQRLYAAEAVSATTVIEGINANVAIVRVNGEIFKVIL